MEFIIDKQNSKVVVKREFAASLEKVWAAWTQSEILDQWWAPKPWKAKTKLMDFREGGSWLYAMIGPAGEEHWSRADFIKVSQLKSYSGRDFFCDAEGNELKEFPASYWNVGFNGNQESTTVVIDIQYDKLEDLEKYIEMGFKEGFTMAMENLDDIFNS